MSLRAARALALVPALAALGCLTINLPGGELSPLVETVVEGDAEGGPKILLVQLDGVIRDEPEDRGFFGFDSEGMVGRLREELKLAREDGDVRALLLRINSPGGTVSGSDLIYQEVERFKQDRGVPVVAQLMGVATSGAYYVAQAADAIHAQPTTVTGSIGVVMAGVNLTGLMEKLGVEDQTLVSGEFKDAGSMLRPMDPEERAQLLGVIDVLHARFVSVVERGRGDLSPEQVRAVSDGRVFSARQALELGLVDAVGGFDEALAEARRLAGLRSARVVTYHRQREYANNFYTRAPLPGGLRAQPSWPERLGLRGPGFLYLWAPGIE